MKPTLLLLALAASLIACAQYDTTNIRTSSTAPQWGWTDPPPPMQLVEAGFAMEADANLANAGWWMLAGGIVAGSAFYIENNSSQAAPVLVGIGLAGHITLGLLATRKRKRAALLLQQGWQPDKLYEMVPDSVGHAVPGTVKRRK